MAVVPPGLGPVSAWLANPSRHAAPTAAPVDPRPVHRTLPGYAPTPVRDAPALAAELGVRELWLKDESVRMRLPSFKILGASYAVRRALAARVGDASDWTTFGDWERAAAAAGALTLVTATDGNHGRAVAYLARMLGLPARVLVPRGVPEAAVAAIGREGAAIDVVEGSYDDAIAALATLDTDEHLVISDTAWTGYEDIPRWVMAGYETIFAEIDDQLAAFGPPDLVLVQAGVGALAGAAVAHWAARADPPRIVAVEPEDAACVMAALDGGQPVLVDGPHRSVMSGLNCGLISPLALPLLTAGLDGAVSVSDEHARAAVRLLADAGLATGATGAAGLAGLLALRASGPEVWSDLGLDGVERVLVLCTEGATASPAA